MHATSSYACHVILCHQACVSARALRIQSSNHFLLRVVAVAEEVIAAGGLCVPPVSTLTVKDDDGHVWSFLVQLVGCLELLLGVEGGVTHYKHGICVLSKLYWGPGVNVRALKGGGGTDGCEAEGGRDCVIKLEKPLLLKTREKREYVCLPAREKW